MKFRIIVSALLLCVMGLLYGLMSGAKHADGDAPNTASSPAPDQPTQENERSYTGLGK